MYVYPIRGIRVGSQVDSLELGAHGAKYDREIVLRCEETHHVLRSDTHLPMSCLRQTLTGSVVTVTTLEPERLRAQNLPESISIDLDQKPETVGDPVLCLAAKGRRYMGYQYSKEVSDWFAAAIDKKVSVVRSFYANKTIPTPKNFPHGKPGDLM